jgi:hypothetical protein
MGPNADKSGWKKQDDHDGMEADNIVAFSFDWNVCFIIGYFGINVKISAFRLKYFKATGAAWRVNNTFRIVEDGRTHAYMQVRLIPKKQEDAGDVISIKHSIGRKSFYAGLKR